MKKVMKIMKIILIVVLISIVVLIAGFIVWIKAADKIPAVKSKYYNEVKPDKEIESIYTGIGIYEVKSVVYDSSEESYEKYRVWYPEELESSNYTYPIVVMANGTGVPYRKYEAVFEHLASWGFIVIGNDDMESWSGTSSSKSLELLIDLNAQKDSIFYQKIDEEHIGVAGHSQGGVAAINAVTNFENSELFTSIYTASCTQLPLAEALKWSYDVSKVRIPYFMVAGTGSADADTITPLSSLEENMAQLDKDILAVSARRIGKDHGQMLTYADGYMTAWFRYTLMGDEKAGEVFIGENPEILDNQENWSDVSIVMGRGFTF